MAIDHLYSGEQASIIILGKRIYTVGLYMVYARWKYRIPGELLRLFIIVFYLLWNLLPYFRRLIVICSQNMVNGRLSI